MDTNKVDFFILSKGNMFPNAQLPFLREKLTEASNEKWIELNATSFKNPTIALIMSVAAGTYGADRFYLGQPLLGVCKLILTLMLIAWAITMQFLTPEDLTVWIFVPFFCIMCLILLWYFIDIFLVSKTAKEQNLNTILTILN